jgi:hypothetical protein
MTAPAIDIIEAATDPELFRSWFRDPSTWRTWFCFLRSMFGLPMNEEDWALFRQCTGRDDRPTGASPKPGSSSAAAAASRSCSR